jgi:hypothetical protein
MVRARRPVHDLGGSDFCPHNGVPVLPATLDDDQFGDPRRQVPAVGSTNFRGGGSTILAETGVARGRP